MSHNSRKHRNGNRVHVVPTDERLEPSRPNNVRAVVVNTPDMLVNGVSFAAIAYGTLCIVIGGVFIKNCNLQPLIPIWLLVLGIILGSGGSWAFLYIRKLKKDPFARASSFQKIVSIGIFAIFIGWFIAGHIWVYKGWVEDPDFGHTWFENGCNKSLFFMSFSTMIILDCFMGVALIGFCIWGLTHVIVKE